MADDDTLATSRVVWVSTNDKSDGTETTVRAVVTLVLTTVVVPLTVAVEETDPEGNEIVTVLLADEDTVVLPDTLNEDCETDAGIEVEFTVTEAEPVELRMEAEPVELVTEVESEAEPVVLETETEPVVLEMEAEPVVLVTEAGPVVLKIEAEPVVVVSEAESVLLVMEAELTVEAEKLDCEPDTVVERLFGEVSVVLAETDESDDMMELGKAESLVVVDIVGMDTGSDNESEPLVAVVVSSLVEVAAELLNKSVELDTAVSVVVGNNEMEMESTAEVESADVVTGLLEKSDVVVGVSPSESEVEVEVLLEDAEVSVIPFESVDEEVPESVVGNSVGISPSDVVEVDVNATELLDVSATLLTVEGNNVTEGSKEDRTDDSRPGSVVEVADKTVVLEAVGDVTTESVSVAPVVEAAEESESEALVVVEGDNVTEGSRDDNIEDNKPGSVVLAVDVVVSESTAVVVEAAIVGSESTGLVLAAVVESDSAALVVVEGNVTEGSRDDKMDGNRPESLEVADTTDVLGTAVVDVASRTEVVGRLFEETVLELEVEVEELLVGLALLLALDEVLLLEELGLTLFTLVLLLLLLLLSLLELEEATEARLLPAVDVEAVGADDADVGEDDVVVEVAPSKSPTPLPTSDTVSPRSLPTSDTVSPISEPRPVIMSPRLREMTSGSCKSQKEGQQLEGTSRTT